MAGPRTQPLPSELVMIASGAVMLIASFMPFYDVSARSWSVWSNAFMLFPLVALLVVFGAGLALAVALRCYAGMKLPARVGPFAWAQFEILLSALTAVTMVCAFFRGSSSLVESGRGLGAWLLLIASITLAVAALVTERRRSASPW